MARSYRYYYKAGIEPETLPELQEIAAALGFINDTPGAAFGLPSPPDLLDALAAAHRKDSVALVAALAALGIQQPETPTHQKPPPVRGTLDGV